MRNIVLLTFDSVRADHCSFHGYERNTTPNMAQLASEGITYENAISPASRTNPSMAGTMTGEPLYYRGKISNPKNARNHIARNGTIAEDLSEMGYSTAAFCPNAYSSRYYGFDRGFDVFEDFLFTSERYQNLFDKHIEESGLFTALRNFRNFVKKEEAFRTWDTYIDDAVDWASDQDDPFFLWMFSLDTHYPYLTPRTSRKYSSLFDQYYYNWICYRLIDEFDADFSEKIKQKMIDIYDDSLRFGDELIAELRDRLAEFDPVFVVHSDHGEAFGERGMYGHSFPYLHKENVHVPLVIDGLNSQDSISTPASLLNLRDSMSEIIKGERPELTDEYVLSSEYDGRNQRQLTAVRSDQYKYIITRRSDSIARNLYDLSNDPEEREDIIEKKPNEAKDLINAGDEYATQNEEILKIREKVNNMNRI